MLSVTSCWTLVITYNQKATIARGVFISDWTEKEIKSAYITSRGVVTNVQHYKPNLSSGVMNQLLVQCSQQILNWSRPTLKDKTNVAAYVLKSYSNLLTRSCW